MSLIDKAKQMRNSIIADMSEVTKEHLPEQEKIRAQEIKNSVDNDHLSITKKYYYLNWQERHYIVPSGASEINVQDVSVREVSNGGDKYMVGNDVFSFKKQGKHLNSSDRDTIMFNIECVNRQFSASKNGKEETLFLTHVKGQETYADFSETKYKAGKTFQVDYVKASLNNGEFFNIPNSVDLTNINAVRYHLRNNKEAAHFLDKYVIVTPDERKSYKEYAKEQDKAFVLQKSKQDKSFGKNKE